MVADMSAVDLACALAAKFEGCRLDPYRDPVGLWTIGRGHLLTPNPNAPKPDIVWTQQQADEAFPRDMALRMAGALRLIRVRLTDGQAAALGDLAFNVGAGRLRGSTLVSRLNRGDCAGAADQFGKWVYSRGVKLPGLVRRRAAEKALFLG